MSAISIRCTIRLLIALVLAAGMATATSATTFTVDSTADEDDATPGDGVCKTASGACTLRAAVTEANDPAVTPDTIVLPAGLYLFSIARTMVISDAITIVGAGADTTVIDAAGIASAFHVLFFPNPSTCSLTLSGVTMENGNLPNSVGGAIFAESPLTLTDSIVRDNFAFNGGAIYSTAETTVARCTLTGNRATALGGAIQGYDLTLVDSTVSGNQANYGGGVFAIGELKIERSTITGNTAVSDGGGIEFQGESAEVTNATVTDNDAARNGGGLHRAGVHEAGGDYQGVGPVLVRNSTITGNRADADGNGDGDGGGVANINAGIRLVDTIVAENDDGGGEAPDCAGPVESLGHDIIGSLDGCTLSGAKSGDVYGVSPALGPLADNGGATMTRALLSTSPAIDAGSPAIGGTTEDSCAATDQRGILRPQPVRCDIGAFEIGTDVCAAPLDGCKAAGPHQAKLAMKRGDRSGRFTWRWRGAATDASELGDPTTGAGYVVCVFDASGPSPHALLGGIAPGGTCPKRPCWRTAGTSLKYKNRLGTPDGIVTLQVKPGADGQAGIALKGGGAALALPTLPLASSSVLLQLRSVDTAACWQARYSTHAVDNATKFGAVSD